MGTLGKAAGVAGAFVAAHPAVIETLVQTARPYVYTTAAPPLLAEALRASLALIRDDRARRAHLAALIARFRERMRGRCRGQLLPSPTPIQPLVVGDNATALALAAALWQRGFWVPAIRPPTVPAGHRAAAHHADAPRTRSPTSMRSPMRCASSRERRRESPTGRPKANAGAQHEGASAVHVESAGAGPPLVLLHGWAMHSGLWGPLFPRARAAVSRARRRPARARPQRAGHARTRSTRSSARSSRGVRRRGRPLTVLGWSLGGAVALHWARAAPERDRAAGARRHDAALRRARRLAARDGRGDARALRRRAARRLPARRCSASCRCSCTAATTGGRRSRAMRAHLFARGEPAPAVLAAALARAGGDRPARRRAARSRSRRW